MNPPAIELEHLTKKFGEKIAVEDLSLTVPRGACFGFLGPNGAGKSTTVNMLSGLLSPSRGLIRVNGLTWGRNALKLKALMGVCPENFLLFDRLTLREHFRMIGPLFKLTAAETEHRAQDLCSFLCLEDGERVLAAEASFGMKKKVAFALALLHNPEIVVLDEPFEGLDPLACLRVQNLIRQMRAKNKTVFLCSHILSVVEELVDEVAIVSGGRLVFHNTIRGIRDSRSNVRRVFMEHAFPGETGAGDLEWLA